MIGQMTEAERGYLAGLIDSDGCIVFARCKRQSRKGRCWDYRLYVIINNTDKRMIDWVASKLPAGKARVQEHPGARRKLALYGFTCSTAQSVVLLRELAPYLVIKREQAEPFANGYRHLSNEDREALYHRMREFKTKGKQRCVSPTLDYQSRRIAIPS